MKLFKKCLIIFTVVNNNLAMESYWLSVNQRAWDLNISIQNQDYEESVAIVQSFDKKMIGFDFSVKSLNIKFNDAQKSKKQVLKEYFESKSRLNYGLLSLYVFLRDTICEHQTVINGYYRKIFNARECQKHEPKSTKFFNILSLPLTLRSAIKSYLLPFENPHDPTKLFLPLQQAIDNEDEKEITKLLHLGCDINAHDDKNRTAVERAVELGKVKSFRAIWTNGIPKLFQKLEGKNGYIARAELNKQVEMSSFLKGTKEWLIKESAKLSKMSFILKDENYSQMLSLVAIGVNPNIAKSNSYTLLSCAATYKLYFLVQLLLEAGADVHQKENAFFCDYPLFRAVEENDLKLAKLLLDHGANPNMTDYLYEPPLCRSLYDNNASMSKLLLDYKADPNILFSNGNPLLVYALNLTSPLPLKLLLDHKANPNARCADKDPVLAYAISGEYLDQVKVLLDARADINARDILNRSMLECAQETKQPAMVKLLLDYAGSRPKSRDNSIPVRVIHDYFKS